MVMETFVVIQMLVASTMSSNSAISFMPLEQIPTKVTDAFLIPIV